MDKSSERVTGSTVLQEVRRIVKTLFFTASVLLLCGCAAIYQPIQWNRIAGAAPDTREDSIAAAVVCSPLFLSENFRYHKRSRDLFIELAGISVTNNGSSDFIFSPCSLRVTDTSGNACEILGLEQILPYLKIPVWEYWLWSLLMIPIVPSPAGLGIPVPVGLAIAAKNVAQASSSNALFEKDLRQYALTAQIIPPGKTVWGLVAVHRRKQGWIPYNQNLKIAFPGLVEKRPGSETTNKIIETDIDQ
ncbi:MAG TPA: hypothetical protein VKF42_09115 [Chitinivibrionales bacterium]|nr:hypothetical protein [Chitinivibrionales bacterium]